MGRPLFRQVTLIAAALPLAALLPLAAGAQAEDAELPRVTISVPATACQAGRSCGASVTVKSNSPASEEIVVVFRLTSDADADGVFEMRAEARYAKLEPGESRTLSAEFQPLKAGHIYQVLAELLTRP